MSETNGRPQQRHIGSLIRTNPSRQVTQIGMRLAFVSAWPQMRHGPGNTIDASASSAPFKITDALLTEMPPETLLQIRRRGKRHERAEGYRRGLEQAFFFLFLAGEAVAGPGHGLEALLLQLLVAGHTFTERIVLHPRERFLDQLQQRAVVVRLAEKEFFRVRVRGLVGEIHRRVLVRFAAFLLRARDSTHQFLAARDQFLFVIFETLLIHRSGPQFGSATPSKTVDFRGICASCQTCRANDVPWTLFSPTVDAAWPQKDSSRTYLRTPSAAQET